MTTEKFYGPSPFDSDDAADESPEMLYSVVVTIVNSEYSDAIGPVGCDDMAHEVFMKVWTYRQTRPIYSLKSFIRRVLSNVRIDMQRKFKPSLYQDFPRDEFGAIREDLLRPLGTAGESDPALLVLDDEQHAALIGQFVNAVAELSPCQREAAVCTYKPRLEEWNEMVVELEKRGINADLEWPVDLADKRRLQASFSHARRNIAQHMGKDLSVYKHR